MDDGAETRRQRKRAALRHSVLNAAEDELATHGVAQFSVERVASRADVAVQTVYNHFGGRDGLLLATAERAMALDREYMDNAYGTLGSAPDRLEAAAAAYAQFAAEHPEQFQLLAFPPGRPYSGEAAGGPGQDVLARIASAVAEQNARLVAALRDGAAAGDIRCVDAERTAKVTWAMFNGLLALGWRSDPLRADADEMKRLLVVALDLLRHGLQTSGDG
ncbi:TetR/AcrR family transcriptional regulator [Nocardia sp. 2YAB30]|uniref:TetR/AcrR family transcriptional regulator n=1 Tax=unclassified Nocardia TaxID=2637762 RepID=UPI003F98A237